MPVARSSTRIDLCPNRTLCLGLKIGATSPDSSKGAEGRQPLPGCLRGDGDVWIGAHRRHHCRFRSLKGEGGSVQSTMPAYSGAPVSSRPALGCR